MNKEQMQSIVEDYIKAYNEFDVEGMTKHLHPDVSFRNTADGEVTHAIIGIEGFRLQAREAAQYFSAREQKITDIQFDGDKAEVNVDYTGVLAVDLPNGLREGDKLELKGKSIFTFEDGQIIQIEDFS
jgi:ketosteroid isomerase-like protein